jgi:hypothetical protein
MSALVPFGENIWVGEGPVVSFYGFPYPTRMAIIRLASGDLFIWSPIALTGELQQEVESLGRVAHLISPNVIHHLFLGDWKKAFPRAKLYASPHLARKRTDLAFDATLCNTPDAAWAAEIDQVEMAGSFFLTEIVFFHHQSRTAIFVDLIENFRPDWFKGWKGWLARLDGIVGPFGGAPREWRLSFLNRKLARERFSRILSWQPEQVIMAHGEMTRTNGAAFIRKSFHWLARD